MRGCWLLALLGACDLAFPSHTTNSDDEPPTDAPVGAICTDQSDSPLRYHFITASDPIKAVVANAGHGTFDEGREQCAIYDMIPIVFDDAAELARRSLSSDAPYWTGLRRAGDAFTSLDGCTPMMNWAPGEPSTAGDCVVVGADGMLRVAACTSAQNFYCETRPGPARCSTPTDLVVVPGPVAGFTESAAKGTCIQMGMQLADFSTPGDFDAALAAMSTANVVNAWVGGEFQDEWTPSDCPRLHRWHLGSVPAPDPKGLSPACQAFSDANEELRSCNDSVLADGAFGAVCARPR